MIAYNDRTLVLGPTGSGKSTLINVQFSAYRCQRVLFDTKDEFSVRGVEPVRDVGAIDWRQPVIHVISGLDAQADSEQLFEAAFRVPGPRIVAVHEAADTCKYRANATGPHTNRYPRQGRAHGKGLKAGSQRPHEMPRSYRSEADHVIVFPNLDVDDLDTVARMIGRRDLPAILDDTLRMHGEHGRVYFEKATRQLVRCPPLPASLIRRSIVTKRSVA